MILKQHYAKKKNSTIKKNAPITTPKRTKDVVLINTNTPSINAKREKSVIKGLIVLKSTIKLNNYTTL